MTAAKTSSTEAVRILLKKDDILNSAAVADPNKVDGHGITALDYALKTDNAEIIDILAEVTTVFTENSVKILAQSNVKVVGHLEEYIQRIINQCQDSVKLLLSSATFYGNSQLIEYLLFKAKLKLSEDCIENVINSDDVKACQLVAQFCKIKQLKIQSKHKKLAKKRGNRAIAGLFENHGMLSILQNTLTKNSDDKENIIPILKRIPKSEEFLHSNVMENIIHLVMNTEEKIGSIRQIAFQTLLDNLHVPTVHYKREDIIECEDKCLQSTTCKRIRDVTNLIDQILNRMSEEFPIFKDVATIVVGSLKEGTKVGGIDEADITLALSETFQNYLTFDKKNQRILVRTYYYENITDVNKIKLELPEALKPFMKDLRPSDIVGMGLPSNISEYFGYIDTNKYFFTFMEEFYKVVASGTLELPDGLVLSTKFTPCTICMNTDNIIPQYIRCKHNPDCEEHLKKVDNPDYEEKCECRNYTSPCMSYSKIGLVLHLQFAQEDGSILNLDVDVNPPSFSVSKRRYRVSHKKLTPIEEPEYDGSNFDKRAWLENHRPVGWRTEWDKSVDMSDAVKEGREEGKKSGLRRAVRLRFYNNMDVLAEQVVITMFNKHKFLF